MLDVNGDGWPDLVIANDTQPNKLYLNNTKGGFTESAVSAGIAFSEDGVARAGMGVDAADYDHTGRPSIVIGNFANQMLALYHNEGNGLFVDEAPRSEVGRRSLLTLGFATLFFDYDNDGWLDIFVANGHIENEIERIQKRVKYAESPHLFHNQGKGQFVEATQSVGPDLGVARVGRGAAYADIDNDGDLDLLLTTNGGPAVLFRNDGGNANHSLRIKLVGTKSNRDGIGTVAIVKAGGDRQTAMLRSGSGYLSSSELVLTFGLGKLTQADEIELRWPSGQVLTSCRRSPPDRPSRLRKDRHCAAARVRRTSPTGAVGGSSTQSYPMEPATQQSAFELLVLLRTNKISALELAEEYIRQIERLNPQLNALVDFNAERVRAQARASDNSANPKGPLAGLPVTVKSSISTAGSPLRDRQLGQSRQRPQKRCDGGGASAAGGRDHSRHRRLP